jgi:RNA polymerase sigma-70 factor (ECF subfamily)
MSALACTPYFSEATATEGFRCGDPAAFEWLASRYREKASGVARSMLHGGADAEDLAHEAFMRAWVHRQQLLAGSAFAPWFFRILRNLAIDFIRRHRRFTDEPLDVRRPALRESSPDVVANGRLIERMIWRALGELPPQQRRVAALFFIDGCPHAEIARTMAIAEGTVRAHLSFARKRLRVVLAEMAD